MRDASESRGSDVTPRHLLQYNTERSQAPHNDVKQQHKTLVSYRPCDVDSLALMIRLVIRLVMQNASHSSYEVNMAVLVLVLVPDSCGLTYCCARYPLEPDGAHSSFMVCIWIWARPRRAYGYRGGQGDCYSGGL